MERNKITLEKIANRAGVSIATVSRVLNNQPVSAGTLEKVESVLTELGPEFSKTFLVKRRSTPKFIVVFMLDLLNPFYAALLKGIEDIADIHNYNIILCDSRVRDSNQRERINLLVSHKMVEGIIDIPFSDDNPCTNPPVRQELPIVFVDNIENCKNISYVAIANLEGAYQATKYLLSLGHRDIAYLAGDPRFHTERDRREGYRKAIEETGIDPDPALVLPGDYNLSKAYQAVSALIKSGRKFTAIFAANDFMAYGARRALIENGLRIPEDVSLLGFDDLEISSAISLTTFSQPAYEIGRNATLLLLDLINQRVKSPQQIVLSPTIVIRNSCGQYIARQA